MLEKIASQVSELRSSTPLPPFGDGRVKVMCIGNCVVNKMRIVLAQSPEFAPLFCSNLYNWGNYHRETFLQRADEADIVIGLHAEFARHPPQELADRYGDRLVTVPNVWLDGLNSLELFSIRGNATFFGDAPLIAEAQATSFEAMSERFLHGDLYTDLTERFTASIDAIRLAEAKAVPISDFVLEHYREHPVANAIGHPSAIVVKELFDRLARRLEISRHFTRVFNTRMIGNLVLPGARRVFSPYDRAHLGIAYDHDVDWLLKARSLLFLLNNRFKKGAYA